MDYVQGDGPYLVVIADRLHKASRTRKDPNFRPKKSGSGNIRYKTSLRSKQDQML